MKAAALCLILFTLSAAILACAAKDDTIRGQVFIVTKGGENMRLGLVTVALFPEAVIEQHIRSRRAASDAERKTIEQQIESAEASLLESERALRAARHAAEAASVKVEQLQEAQFAAPHNDWDKWYRVIETTKNERARQTKVMGDWKLQSEIRTAAVVRLLEQLASIDTGPFYLVELTEPVARTQSDANGDFALQVPRGHRFALAATAQRLVGSSTEEYTWLVRIPDEARRGSKVLLSNETLTTGGSPLSLVRTLR